MTAPRANQPHGSSRPEPGSVGEPIPTTDSEPVPTTDNLIHALAERLQASVSEVLLTARLALAETRLAASSAGLLLAIMLVGIALVVVTWVVGMALLAALLHSMGFSVLAALTTLFILHLLAGAALGFAAWRISRHVRFVHTRQALRKVEDADA